MSSRQKQLLQMLTVSAALVISALFALDLFLYSAWPTYAVTTKSPSGKREAVFIVESAFIENSTYFFVRDPEWGQGDILVEIGEHYASDGGRQMHDAVWSKDGTVIAVRGEQWLSNNSAPLVGFLEAYDFQQHKRVSSSRGHHQQDRKIQSLMTRRGGLGTIIPYPGGGTAERISWWENRRFERRVYWKKA
jgi:hypothetical protein